MGFAIGTIDFNFIGEVGKLVKPIVHALKFCC